MLLPASIFCSSALFATGSGVFCGIRYGRHAIEFRLCLFALSYLFLSYVLCFAAVCLHPYWIDNQVEEFIPMSERWFLALLGATVFEVILCPLLVVGYFILRSRDIRKRAASRISNTVRDF